MDKDRFHLSFGQFLAIGFAGIILLGAALLCLPGASKSGEGIHFIDALLTASSATCVTLSLIHI